jgi:hypothetical protein
MRPTTPYYIAGDEPPPRCRARLGGWYLMVPLPPREERARDFMQLAYDEDIPCRQVPAIHRLH